MPFKWYICPFDVIPRPGSSLGPSRRVAIERHIPFMPNSEGSRWEEAEILGNHVLLKVSAPLTRLTLIDLDTDFMSFNAVLIEILPNRRNAVRAKLNSLGYTDAEINGTNWVTTALLAMLTTAISEIALNTNRDGFVVGPGRRVAPKTVDQIEARLPG